MKSEFNQADNLSTVIKHVVYLYQKGDDADDNILLTKLMVFYGIRFHNVQTLKINYVRSCIIYRHNKKNTGTFVLLY